MSISSALNFFQSFSHYHSTHLSPTILNGFAQIPILKWGTGTPSASFDYPQWRLLDSISGVVGVATSKHRDQPFVDSYVVVSVGSQQGSLGPVPPIPYAEPPLTLTPRIATLSLLSVVSLLPEYRFRINFICFQFYFQYSDSQLSVSTQIPSFEGTEKYLHPDCPRLPSVAETTMS